MDTKTPPTVARQLGISLPRLHRALSGLPGVQKTKGGHVRLEVQAVRQLEQRFGLIPKVPGLSRCEVQVLVALSRHPRGLISARQAAQAAAVSPTVAGRAIARLSYVGLVRTTTTRLFEGRVENHPIFEVDWSSAPWRNVAPLLSRAVVPKSRKALDEPHRLPARLASVFWSGTEGRRRSL